MVLNIKITTIIKNFSFHFPADTHDASKTTSLDGVINPTVFLRIRVHELSMNDKCTTTELLQMFLLIIKLCCSPIKQFRTIDTHETLGNYFQCRGVLMTQHRRPRRHLLLECFNRTSCYSVIVFCLCWPDAI